MIGNKAFVALAVTTALSFLSCASAVAGMIWAVAIWAIAAGLW